MAALENVCNAHRVAWKDKPNKPVVRANRLHARDVMDEKYRKRYEAALNNIEVAQLLLERRKASTCHGAVAMTKETCEAPICYDPEYEYYGEGPVATPCNPKANECEDGKKCGRKGTWFERRRQEWTLTFREKGTRIDDTKIRIFLKKRQAELEHLRRANRAHKDDKVYIAFK